MARTVRYARCGEPKRPVHVSTTEAQPKAEERWKLESRMMRKCPVRFGGGPGEKAETSDLACGLPYPASSRA
jgi:hypothetical protein